MAISKKAIAITDKVYAVYGSGGGVLFGIPPALCPSVQAVISVALDFAEDYKEEEEESELEVLD